MLGVNEASVVVDESDSDLEVSGDETMETEPPATAESTPSVDDTQGVGDDSSISSSKVAS